MKPQRIATAVLLGVLALPVGAAGGAAHGQSLDEWITVTLVDKVKANPRYKRIPIDTQAAADEFRDWMRALWLQRISPDEFKRMIAQKYPGHDYEADFIVANMPPVPQRSAQ